MPLPRLLRPNRFYRWADLKKEAVLKKEADLKKEDFFFFCFFFFLHFPLYRSEYFCIHYFNAKVFLSIRKITATEVSADSELHPEFISREKLSL